MGRWQPPWARRALLLLALLAPGARAEEVGGLVLITGAEISHGPAGRPLAAATAACAQWRAGRKGPYRNPALLVPTAQQTTRAYRGLWGGLFRQQAGGSSSEGRASPTDRFRQALADLQPLLHPSNDAVTSSSGAQPSGGSSLRHLPSLEEVAAHVGNLTASLLESAHSGGGGTSALLQRLARNFGHSSSTGSIGGSLDAAQLAATVASMQAWALAGLVARSGGSGLSGGGGSPGLSSSLDPTSFKQVAGERCWAAVRCFCMYMTMCWRLDAKHDAHYWLAKASTEH